jgi:hypothetical protein
MRWKEYGEAEERIANLHARIHRGVQSGAPLMARFRSSLSSGYLACICPCPALRVPPHDRMVRGQDGSPVYPDAIHTEVLRHDGNISLLIFTGFKESDGT